MILLTTLHQRVIIVHASPELYASLCDECDTNLAGFPNLPPLNLTLVVAVALIDADNRILLAQRPEGKQLAGLWEFPGGKLEAGERPEDGADSRIARRTRDRREGGLPRAADLREPRLRDVPPSDAALCLPALGRVRAAAGRPDPRMGQAAGAAQAIRCRRPTSR